MSPPQSAQNFLDNALVWAFQSYIRECVFHKRNIDVFDSATDMWPSRFDSMGKLQATTHRDTWCKKDVIALVHLRKDLGLPWGLLVALFFPSRLVTDCKRAYHIQQGGDHDGIDFEVMAEDTRPTEYCDTEFRSVYRQALAENVRLEFDKVLAAQQLMNYRMELFDKFPGWTNYDKYLSNTIDFRNHASGANMSWTIEDRWFLTFVYDETSVPLEQICEHFLPLHSRGSDRLTALYHDQNRGLGLREGIGMVSQQEEDASLVEESKISEARKPDTTQRTTRAPLSNGASRLPTKAPIMSALSQSSRSYKEDAILVEDSESQDSEDEADDSEEAENIPAPTAGRKRARPSANTTHRPSKVPRMSAPSTTREDRQYKRASRSTPAVLLPARAPKMSAPSNTATQNTGYVQKEKGTWSVSDERLLLSTFRPILISNNNNQPSPAEITEIMVLFPRKEKHVVVNKIHKIREKGHAAAKSRLDECERRGKGGVEADSPRKY